MSSPILPGAAIGVLGSGQLGRMFALAARRMGYRVHTFSPDDDTPTGQVADLEVTAPYEDLDRVRAFARQVRVVTFEFENVPGATAMAAAECAEVRPNGSVLETTQNRLREKRFLQQHGFPVAPFVEVRTPDDLTAGLTQLGLPAVLKTAGWGYDGKGQSLIKHLDQAPAAWQAMAGQPCVLEAFVPFACEASVVAARDIHGNVVTYGPIHNEHVHHILDVSILPAGLPAAVSKEAKELAISVVQTLDVVGVLCVEFFVGATGQLVINELAPRPHNSGHLTIDACQTSQFEQQLRAICGLPLGCPDQTRPAAMVNLLGDLWAKGECHWERALAMPGVQLHLYGKTAPRPGRKMGHLTALADTAEAAARLARHARACL